MTHRRCLFALLLGVAPMGCATTSTRSSTATGTSTVASAEMASHAGHAMPAAAPAPAPAASVDAHAGHAMAGHAMGHGMAGGHKMDLGNIPAPTIPAGALITEADVRFMQGMIGHHAQAIEMTRIARANGSDPYVLKLAQKIDLSQAGEIALMQDWLRAHGQFAPDTSSWRTMSMMGLLTADEMKQLESTKGPAFDRLFLTLMINHHEGAVMMVQELFATPRAGQEVDVSVLANDIETTQTAEIAVMRQLLLDL